jgi:hypothetical protein
LLVDCERLRPLLLLGKSGGQLEQILAACWEETLDPGPYDFGDRLDWGKVLQGDRFYTLLQIRTLSYGPEYAFGVACENRACRARIDWELRLTDLPVKQLSEESRAAFLAGNPVGEIAWSDVFNVIRDTEGVRKIGDRQGDLKLNGLAADIELLRQV